MLIKTKFVLATVLALAALSPAYAAGGGNNAHQTYLDQQYARRHPVIVPGTSPGLSPPATAYGFVPSAPGARSSFAYQPHHHKIIKDDAAERIQDRDYKQTLGLPF